MVMTTPWTDEELADVRLPWEEFKLRHGTRSRQAWRQKLREVLAGDGPVPRVKPAPIVPPPDPYDDEHLLDAAIAYQDEVNRAFPHTLEYRVAVETDEPIAIAFPSDWHIGSEGCDLRRIREDCELIAAHPRLYVAVGGDPVDNFILAKMMSASRSQVQQVAVQWRLFRHMVQLIHPSLLWVSSGNHDAWTQMVAGIDGVPAALSGIPVCYTGEGGYIDVRIGQQTYCIWRKHRPTRFNSTFNRTHFLKQMARIELVRDIDVAISEHLHDAGVELWNYKAKQRVLLNLGSYKVMDRWAESVGFYGGGYGVPTVVFYPNKRKMLAFYSIEDALEVLDGLTSRSTAA